MLLRFIFIIFLVSFTYNGYAYEYEGKVIRVIDGDTIIVLSSDNKKNKIRLSYIDAPEISQQYGINSKNFLENIILNKVISINTEKKDRYNRQLAEIYIYLQDNTVFVNAKMIKSGNAWVYKFFRSNKYLINLERHARKNKLGLWAYSSAVEPWVYRK